MFGDVKPNIVHFTEILASEPNIHLNDTTVRKIIDSAGIASPKSHRKTRRRLKKNERPVPENASSLTSALPSIEPFIEE